MICRGVEFLEFISAIPVRCVLIIWRRIPGIHKGYINLETWDVQPEFDTARTDLADQNFPESPHKRTLAHGIEHATNIVMSWIC